MCGTRLRCSRGDGAVPAVLAGGVLPLCARGAGGSALLPARHPDVLPAELRTGGRSRGRHQVPVLQRHGFDADHPDTPDNPNLVLAYLRDSGADILCLQEYIRGGRLKQSHIDRVLSAYPYKDVRRVGKGGNHLACYSRYPILHARTIDYGSDFNGSVVYTCCAEATR